MKLIFKKQFLFIFLSLIFLPLFAQADNIGHQQIFYVEPNYAESKKTQINATLVRASDFIYFYIDTDWLNTKTEKEKESFYSALSNLGKEFDSNIYPQLTYAFGSEPSPGVDKDPKITALLYPMKESARGYVRSVDLYEKFINPLSNQREMVYLNLDNLTNPLMKSFLAHEFTHLIVFNQKNLIHNVSESVWLNEGRAEYAPTLLGYNSESQGSYLNNRIKTFINNSSNPLLEWSNESADYGIVSLFVHYLADQYGLSVLSDSLKSKKIGQDSINEALLKNGFNDTFNDAYTNFLIAAYLNDCSVSSKYCFKDSNLTDFHVLPYNNFLPFADEINLSLGQNLSSYSAHWQKFSGGTGNLKIIFKNQSSVDFVVPYILKYASGKSEVKFLSIDKETKTGEIVVPNINQNVLSIVLIPSIQTIGTLGSVNSYFISASTYSGSNPNNNQNQNNEPKISLPFVIEKPLTQMNREELLTVLLRLVVYLLIQGKSLPL